MDVKGAATRKIGPLPAWGWGVAIGGALLAFRFLRGGGSGGSGGNGAQPDTILVPSGAPSIPHDYIGQLGQAVGEIRDRLTGIEESIEDAATPTPEPTPPQSGGNPIQQPTPSSPGTPVSATPSRLTVAQAQAILRDMGFRESLATSGAWIRAGATDPNAASAYVWKSADAFRSWVNRTTRANPDAYR